MYTARVFIDATYEGDLMAAAGVRYHVGRESNETFGEALNGVQPKLNVKNHFFTHPVNPYVTPGDPTSGLVWASIGKNCRRTAAAIELGKRIASVFVPCHAIHASSCDGWGHWPKTPPSALTAVNTSTKLVLPLGTVRSWDKSGAWLPRRVPLPKTGWD